MQIENERGISFYSSADIVRFLDTVMVYGVYLYALTMFNPHVVALHSIGMYLPLLCWLIKHAITRGRLLGYFRNSVSVMVFAFAMIVLLSVVHSPDMFYSLDRFRRGLGSMLFLFVVTADVFRDERKLLHLAAMLAFGGLIMMLLDMYQYYHEFVIRLYANLSMRDSKVDLSTMHRWYSESLLYLVPFMLFMAIQRRGKPAFFWWLVFMVDAVLLFVTGARGPWVGFSAAIVVWSLVKADKKLLLLSAAGMLALSTLAFVLAAKDPGANLIASRFKQGLQTGRINAIWRPTDEMILDKPLTGYGVGRQIYYNEFNRRAAVSSWWPYKKAQGTHSNYMQIAFAAGVPALLVFVFMYARVFATLWKLSRISRSPPQANIALVTLMSFTGHYMVRGSVENLPWIPLGILLGITVALVMIDKAGSPAQGRKEGNVKPES
ncbi:MAG: O-antigen ligase family protein [Gammaproteobacteria bacterium]|nr:O-antigen ligase family protein [Gammaproteobacteria bacterium]